MHGKHSVFCGLLLIVVFCETMYAMDSIRSTWALMRFGKRAWQALPTGDRAVQVGGSACLGTVGGSLLRAKCMPLDVIVRIVTLNHPRMFDAACGVVLGVSTWHSTGVREQQMYDLQHQVASIETNVATVDCRVKEGFDKTEKQIGVIGRKIDALSGQVRQVDTAVDSMRDEVGQLCVEVKAGFTEITTRFADMNTQLAFDRNRIKRNYKALMFKAAAMQATSDGNFARLERQAQKTASMLDILMKNQCEIKGLVVGLHNGAAKEGASLKVIEAAVRRAEALGGTPFRVNCILKQ